MATFSTGIDSQSFQVTCFWLFIFKCSSKLQLIFKSIFWTTKQRNYLNNPIQSQLFKNRKYLKSPKNFTPLNVFIFHLYGFFMTTEVCFRCWAVSKRWSERGRWYSLQVWFFPSHILSWGHVLCYALHQLEPQQLSHKVRKRCCI